MHEHSPNKKRKMPNEAGSVGRLRRHTSRCHEEMSSFSKPKRRFIVLVCSDGARVSCLFSLLPFFFPLDGSTYGAPVEETNQISLMSPLLLLDNNEIKLRAKGNLEYVSSISDFTLREREKKEHLICRVSAQVYQSLQ